MMDDECLPPSGTRELASEYKSAPTSAASDACSNFQIPQKQILCDPRPLEAPEDPKEANSHLGEPENWLAEKEDSYCQEFRRDTWLLICRVFVITRRRKHKKAESCQHLSFAGARRKSERQTQPLHSGLSRTGVNTCARGRAGSGEGRLTRGPGAGRNPLLETAGSVGSWDRLEGAEVWGVRMAAGPQRPGLGFPALSAPPPMSLGPRDSSSLVPPVACVPPGKGTWPLQGPPRRLAPGAGAGSREREGFVDLCSKPTSDNVAGREVGGRGRPGQRRDGAPLAFEEGRNGPSPSEASGGETRTLPAALRRGPRHPAKAWPTPGYGKSCGVSRGQRTERGGGHTAAPKVPRLPLVVLHFPPRGQGSAMRARVEPLPSRASPTSASGTNPSVQARDRHGGPGPPCWPASPGRPVRGERNACSLIKQRDPQRGWRRDRMFWNEGAAGRWEARPPLAAAAARGERARTQSSRGGGGRAGGRGRCRPPHLCGPGPLGPPGSPGGHHRLRLPRDRDRARAGLRASRPPGPNCVPGRLGFPGARARFLPWRRTAPDRRSAGFSALGSVSVTPFCSPGRPARPQAPDPRWRPGDGGGRRATFGAQGLRDRPACDARPVPVPGRPRGPRPGRSGPGAPGKETLRFWERGMPSRRQDQRRPRPGRLRRDRACRAPRAPAFWSGMRTWLTLPQSGEGGRPRLARPPRCSGRVPAPRRRAAPHKGSFGRKIPPRAGKREAGAQKERTNSLLLVGDSFQGPRQSPSPDSCSQEPLARHQRCAPGPSSRASSGGRRELAASHRRARRSRPPTALCASKHATADTRATSSSTSLVCTENETERPQDQGGVRASEPRGFRTGVKPLQTRQAGAGLRAGQAAAASRRRRGAATPRCPDARRRPRVTRGGCLRTAEIFLPHVLGTGTPRPHLPDSRNAALADLPAWSSRVRELEERASPRRRSRRLPGPARVPSTWQAAEQSEPWKTRVRACPAVASAARRHGLDPGNGKEGWGRRRGPSAACGDRGGTALGAGTPVPPDRLRPGPGWRLRGAPGAAAEGRGRRPPPRTLPFTPPPSCGRPGGAGGGVPPPRSRDCLQARAAGVSASRGPEQNAARRSRRSHRLRRPPPRLLRGRPGRAGGTRRPRARRPRPAPRGPGRCHGCGSSNFSPARVTAPAILASATHLLGAAEGEGTPAAREVLRAGSAASRVRGARWDVERRPPFPPPPPPALLPPDLREATEEPGKDPQPAAALSASGSGAPSRATHPRGGGGGRDAATAPVSAARPARDCADAERRAWEI
ncbi:collagen, type I, alpha 1b-like [Dipodomys merriami]|uniref:collagen, type I, alpha 1b-like n=1 Tax=Dipodomys merriami TaxID=94247 RepID=UPI003855A3FE